MEVNAWVEKVSIPTYGTGKPEKNPMFLEKRVYQGSSGVVYPHPVIEKIEDEKRDREYTAVFLENEYLKIMILPELGGRIQRAYDKVKQRDFVYYNQVIKPALVGLAGPWISGGIEFNWPQHHRPSTFSPVDYKIQENADGSKTVWVNELEVMFRTKGMAGFTLYPGKAYLEISGKLFNPTPFPQTFLWWANPAVKVNDDYQSVFPPDVYAVFDHGKRDVSDFPIATGTYYKVDYAPGTDISRYKNIPVPTSYMAIQSKYDFMGCYEHDTKGGMLHVADHHVSPGKKQWTWGNGDFGFAWDRNLTDEDGPYIELMTGVFTDNQPDFSWLQPNEGKTFEQYFMPYAEIGVVKNATKEAMISAEKQGNSYVVKVYATALYKDAVIKVLYNGQEIKRVTATIAPDKVFETSFDIQPDLDETELQIVVTDDKGLTLVIYQPEKNEDQEIPAAAVAAKQPVEIEQVEDLFLNGLHLEQYRHATYNPLDYYEEALRRSPGDIRCNNAIGLLLLKRGQFAKAEPYFRTAIKTITKRNPNPYDGEPYFNLGLSLKLQGKPDEAFDAFYKATWNDAMQHSAYLELARIATAQGKFEQALSLVKKSLIRNYHSSPARFLKASLLRLNSRADEALAFINESLVIDPFNYGCLFEAYLLAGEDAAKLANITNLMRGEPNNYLELSLGYAQADLFSEALQVLEGYEKSYPVTNPMVSYYKCWFATQKGDAENAKLYAKEAAANNTGICFPNKVEEILILQNAVAINPTDARAYYYLGNLWYDKRQYSEAIDCWERSVTLDNSFPTVYRNLSLAYYNKLNQKERSLAEMEKAFELDTTDARVLMELDQLYKISGRSFEDRFELLGKYPHLVNERDDLYLERIVLLNNLHQYKAARELLTARQFHPWEGGEGKVIGQFLLCHIELAKEAIKNGDHEQAIALLSSLEKYPDNLGEGKLYNTPENDINYLLGCAYEGLRLAEAASARFKAAIAGNSEPVQAIYYNDPQPDKILYQAFAWQKLGEQQKAQHIFRRFIDFGTQHMNDEIRIDYFAVSLPDMLVFDIDINRRNYVFCNYLIGLGKMGLGEVEQGKQLLQKVLEMDNNHQGAAIHLQMADYFKQINSTYVNNTSGELQVTTTPCGELNDEPLYLISLASGELVVNLTNLGGAITAIWTPNRDGKRQNIVAGYINVTDYTDNPHYFGCLLGRNAGRISDSKFELDSDVVFLSRNDGMNHLHGGIEGFNKKVWKIKSFIQEESEAGVILEYLSEDGDEGYPGNLWVTVKYSVNSRNQLKIEYDAVTDKSTPVNLSNHTYFNLSGFENLDILGHELWVNADSFTEVDDRNIPTGKIIKVEGTPLDLSVSTEIGARIDEVGDGEGYNHNFVLNNLVEGTTRLSAILSDPASGRTVKVYTDRPGMQVYTANDWSGNIIGPQGFTYQRHGAVALETQAFPDSPNQPEFPDTILRPGQRYLAETIYEFTCQ